MTVRIEIKSTEVRPRTINSNGKSFQFLEQEGWIHTLDPAGNPNAYPEKFIVTLPKGQEQPYPVGDYTLHPGSFYVGRFRRLDMSPRLAPVKARG